MFQGTIKDIVTNIFALISTIVAVYQLVSNIVVQWFETASPKPTLAEWIQLVVLIAVAVVAFFTGKDSNGKPKKVA